LMDKKEHRLLRAVESGQMPISVAIAIAGAEDQEVQAALQQAYDTKVLRGSRLIAAKRLVELKVDVVESGRFTPYVLTEALSETLRRCGVAAEAIDVCVIPEGNAGYMTDELREAGLLTPEWLALEDKIFENLSLVGATGSAAVPLAVDYAWSTGRVKAGDMMMILAIETSKWKYAGMVLPWTANAISAGQSGAVDAILA